MGYLSGAVTSRRANSLLNLMRVMTTPFNALSVKKVSYDKKPPAEAPYSTLAISIQPANLR
jgi:hypothetical protein